MTSYMHKPPSVAGAIRSRIIGAISWNPGRMTKGDKILVAAFVVAIFRQMGVNGHFIGFDPAEWLWFGYAEVWAGVALAALEGYAAGYIGRRWRRIELQGNQSDWRSYIYWFIVLGGIILLYVSIIFTVGLYGYASQQKTLVVDALSRFGLGATLVWNFTVAGIPVLIALLVGIVQDEDHEEGLREKQLENAVENMKQHPSAFSGNGSSDITESETTQFEEGWLALIKARQEGKAHKITPEELASYAGISEAVAGLVITQAASYGWFNKKERPETYINSKEKLPATT